MTPLVVDTNVVVAGLISNSTESPVCKILDGMLAGGVPFVLSPELLDEYRRVLLRPSISRLHALTGDQVDVVLTEIVTNAIFRDPDAGPRAPDSGDDHLWQLLATILDATLVTGDQRLIDNPPEFGSVLSPRSAWQMLER